LVAAAATAAAARTQESWGAPCSKMQQGSPNTPSSICAVRLQGLLTAQHPFNPPRGRPPALPPRALLHVPAHAPKKQWHSGREHVGRPAAASGPRIKALITAAGPGTCFLPLRHALCVCGGGDACVLFLRGGGLAAVAAAVQGGLCWPSEGYQGRLGGEGR
jgi:hypothetical protein